MNRYKCEKKIFFCEKNFSGGGRLTLSKKNFSGLRPEKFFFGYTWIHLDTPGNCQVLPDTPERPEKCPRVWFLGPGVSRSFQVGGNCEKKFQGGLATPGITLPARMVECKIHQHHQEYKLHNDCCHDFG